MDPPNDQQWGDGQECVTVGPMGFQNRVVFRAAHRFAVLAPSGRRATSLRGAVRTAMVRVPITTELATVELCMHV